ncbi:MAG: diaminopimelate epimerase [Bacteroidetes bacterium]|nr:diaminopimelate epimerase [Bacteroidota bacterium]MCY4279891.1 diaminopimelate epimerase [Acidimicrobiaceae bacterium]
MSRALIIEFVKMSGAGNDFIVLDNRFYGFSDSELSSLAKKACPRRTGIGADGLLALAAAELPDADYRMIYINADGSEGTMCGNGARCLAKFAFKTGLCKDVANMQTSSGICEVHISEEGPVRIYQDFPLNYNNSIVLQSEVPAEIQSVHYLWPGTQHIVCFVSDVDQLPVEHWGPRFRNDPGLGPEGANINFVSMVSNSGEKYLHVRTYEKGVEEETLACGTGAIASVVAAHHSGIITVDVCKVKMPGGILTVGLKGNRIFLEGPAETVYRGSMKL